MNIRTLPRNTSSYGVASTKFFRTNSQILLKRSLCIGSNLQNVGEEPLKIYIPDGWSEDLYLKCLYYQQIYDPGIFTEEERSFLKIFVQVDQAGADALIVAWLLPLGNFRELFLCGIKPHVFVAFHIFFNHWRTIFSFLDSSWLDCKPSRLAQQPGWKEVASIIKKDKRRYFIGKKCCHSFNYRMRPATFRTDVLKESEGQVVLSVKESEYYHSTYHALFPEISNIWWPQLEQQIRATRTLYNLFGFPLSFYGPITEELLREITACIPASTVAIINNTAETELQEWLDFNPSAETDLLNNKHDSLLCQCPIGSEKVIADVMKSCIEQELENFRGEKFRMRSEAKVGFNWGEHDELENPMGLQEL